MVQLYLAWSNELALRWSSGPLGWLPIKIGASADLPDRLLALRDGFVDMRKRGAPLAACSDWALVEICSFSDWGRATNVERALRDHLLSSASAAEDLVTSSKAAMTTPPYAKDAGRSNGVGELRLSGRRGAARQVLPLADVNPPFEAVVAVTSDVLDVACAVMRLHLRQRDATRLTA